MLRQIPLLFALLICAAPQAANAMNPERWWGRFCCEEGQCLSIANLGEGPESWYFSFLFQQGDAELGSAMAALEGNKAQFAALVFTMREDGGAVVVTVDPKEPPPEGAEWISKVREGVYDRVP